MSTRLNDIAGDLESRASEIEQEYPDLAHVPLELRVAAKRIRLHDGHPVAWVDDATRLIASLQSAVVAVQRDQSGGAYARKVALDVLEKSEASSMTDEERLQQPDYLLARAVTLHIALAQHRGLEVCVFEDEGDVRPHPDVATDVYLFTLNRPARVDFRGHEMTADSVDFRVIVRRSTHVAVQYRVGDHWESPTFFDLGITADAILAMAFQRLVPFVYRRIPAQQSVTIYQMNPVDLR